MKKLMIKIPDAEFIDELLTDLYRMKKKDLIANCAFHMIALNSALENIGLDENEIFTYLDAVGDGIEEAFDRRKGDYS